MGAAMKWTRRGLLGVGALVGGGLAVGLYVTPNRLKISSPAAVEGDEVLLNTWVKITPDDQVTVIAPHSEMGQGVGTALAQMLAEEMEADWSKVSFEQAPADEAHANSDMARAVALGEATLPGFIAPFIDYRYFKVSQGGFRQVTAASSSIRLTGWHGMRRAGASAREMLQEAAAKLWAVDADMCEARRGRVRNLETNVSASFGELAEIAGRLTPPLSPRLKARENYTIVGQPALRMDIPDKTAGAAEYGIDVRLPDMSYAAVAAAPVMGATISRATPGADIDLATAEIITLDHAVAVVADSYWRAQRILDAVEIITEGGQRDLSSEAVLAAQTDALASGMGETVHAEGDVSSAGGGINASYVAPYLAHAAMEPLNCTVWIREGGCEVWVGHQNPLHVRDAVAARLGLPTGAVIIHNRTMGGSFGRRATVEFVELAVDIARNSKGPVQVIWSREEDLRQDMFRPAVSASFKGAVDPNGGVAAWDARYIQASWDDPTRPEVPPYTLPNIAVTRVDQPSPAPVGLWRSVDHSQHGFFTESFMDELAAAAEVDPVEFRLAHLPQRHRKVLSLAAEMSGWGSATPEGRGRGAAIVESFGAIVAQIVEVSVTGDNQIKAEHVWAAVDCGLVINPDGAEAQIQGAVNFALSAALYGEINIEAGEVRERNFPDYEMVRMASAPRIDVQFVDSAEPPGGLGEPGVPPLAPALANAIFAVTGKRVRRLPVTREGFVTM